MEKHLLMAKHFAILPTYIKFYLNMFKYLKDRLNLIHKQLFVSETKYLSNNYSNITIMEYLGDLPLIYTQILNNNLVIILILKVFVLSQNTHQLFHLIRFLIFFKGLNMNFLTDLKVILFLYFL